MKIIKAKLLKEGQTIITEYGQFKVTTVFTDGNDDINIICADAGIYLQKKLNLYRPIIKNPEVFIRIEN